MKKIKVLYKILLISLTATFSLHGCKIENDIPYPLLEGIIQAIEVEGQCDAEGNSSTQATINKTARTVQLYVDDTVDLNKVRITKLTVTNDATLVVMKAEDICNNAEKFPTTGFESLDKLPVSADTRINFSKQVDIRLKTYQDYDWKLRVSQVVNRSAELENQVGNAVIDPVNHKAVIYVSPGQDLSKIQVNSFNLGGPHGTVVPDPTASLNYDFSDPCTFFVSHGWEEVSYKWTVYVYHANEEEQTGVTETAARSTKCILSGNTRAGKTPTVEYKRASDNNWRTLATGYVTTAGRKFTATIDGLKPNSQYKYRITIDGETGDEQSFTTASATALTDGSLDDWHSDGKLYNPWATGGTAFWDTGNRGATTVGNSNSVPTTETSTGSGNAAFLESRWIVLKFAAGNIFTGDYRKTVGTNGVLSFGRPFTAYPNKLKFSYKYAPETIDKIGEDSFKNLEGEPDSCHVYIALTDWDEQLEIRTRPSERQLFDKNADYVIAYAELIKGETVGSWTEAELELNYRDNRQPKHILVVASSSKYGDYFTGGVGSRLWVDNFELVY